jgi:hypothetical protein
MPEDTHHQSRAEELARRADQLLAEQWARRAAATTPEMRLQQEAGLVVIRAEAADRFVERANRDLLALIWAQMPVLTPISTPDWSGRVPRAPGTAQEGPGTAPAPRESSAATAPGSAPEQSQGHTESPA